MGKVALVRTATGEVISVHEEGKGGVDLPDGAGRVSPPIAGWEGGAVGMSGGKQTSAPFRFVPVEEASIPEGKVRAGASSYELDGSVVREVPQIKDPPSEGERISFVLRMAGFETASDFLAALQRAASMERE